LVHFKRQNIYLGPQSDNEHWAVGWGRTNNIKRSQGDRHQGGAFINILQKLKLPIVPPETCRTWGEDKGIKESPFRTIATDKYLCAGGRKSKFHYSLYYDIKSLKILIPIGRITL
jgi:hypothetical protein